MSKSSKQWLDRHKSDQYVKKAQHSNYRSRAAYKLLEIDQRDKLFQPGQIVVDLGAAPGSWSQYASKKVTGEGKVVAVDILSMDTINGVEFIQGDFTDNSVFTMCLDALDNLKVDLVISDMAPNLSGIRSTDQARAMYLAELAYEFSCKTLKSKGSLLIKLFQGEGSREFKQVLQSSFRAVMIRKPKASRDSSREFYVLAKDYIV